jgi:large subunit ribosomal protein L15
MPLQRRLPKRGFKNIFRRDYTIVNLDQLSEFPAGSEITIEKLIEAGVVKKANSGLVVLGRGDVPHAFNIKAMRVSDSAKQKIEAKGGKVEVTSV